MNQMIIPIKVEGASRQRKREAPKGRRIGPAALVQVQALLGEESRRADMLIEHLHKIQDSFGASDWLAVEAHVVIENKASTSVFAHIW